MPRIENLSLANVQQGHHIPGSENCMLIQILDPDMKFPTPKYQFKETHQFQFLDIEEDGLTNLGDGEMVDVSSMAVKDQDAEQLVNLLKHALDHHMDVVVHCHAGICRSGAVAEVGVMMGFRDAEVFRSPKLLVKNKMMKSLGWLYDEEEPHSINGEPVQEDWTNDNEKVFTLAAERRKRRQRQGDI